MQKRLLFITPIFPSSAQDDTITPFIYQFTKYYVRAYPDVKIDVLSFHYPLQKGMHVMDGIRVYSLGFGFKKKHTYLTSLYAACRKTFQLHRKNKYAGILSLWYGKTALTGEIMRTFLKINHACWLQGQDVKSTNFYFRLFKMRASQLIVVGKKHQELLRQHQELKADHIANIAITPQLFPKLNEGDRTIDIIGVGNLGALKNYAFFIDIIHELKQRSPEKVFNVVICGGGEQRAELAHKINSLQLSKEITLLGYVSNMEVLRLINDAKIFLHTSTFEGGPMVIQEALYSGCQVISSFDIGIEKGKCSSFYYAASLDQLTTKIQELLLIKKSNYHRVHLNKMEDTVQTIHKLYF